MGIKNICFIGAGHVGAPAATVLAFFHPTLHIIVADKSATLIRRWNSRHLPLNDEPCLRYLVRVTRDGTLPTLVWAEDDQTVERPARKPNLVFSNDVESGLREADIVFLCVETPTMRKGIAVETKALETAVGEVAEWAKEGVVVVVKSTVPVGMAGRIRETISEIRPEMSFEVLSNPEFLSEGEAVKNLLNPDRVLIGSSMTSTGHTAALALINVYSSWVASAKIQMMSSLSAELAKLAANAMLAQRISSINAISAICEQTGADISDVQVAIGSDSRIGSDYLRAGMGFGGSCFKKDILNLVDLAESLDLPGIGEYWSQVLRINHVQSRRFVQRVVSKLDGSLSDKKIAILGWAFKKGTSDSRETRSAHILKELLKKSVSEITVFDPRCNSTDIEKEVHSIQKLIDRKSARPGTSIVVHESPYTACQGADGILILTDWDLFKCLPKPTGPSIVPPEAARDAEIFGSDSYFSWTDRRQSDVGLSLSKLSILDSDRTNDRSNCTRDSIRRLKPDLPCPSNCQSCRRKASLEDTDNQIDWERISAAVKSPRWVFDGRNVVDIGEMEKLGFRVEAIGKVSAWGPSRALGRNEIKV